MRYRSLQQPGSGRQRDQTEVVSPHGLPAAAWLTSVSLEKWQQWLTTSIWKMDEWNDVFPGLYEWGHVQGDASWIFPEAESFIKQSKHRKKKRDTLSVPCVSGHKQQLRLRISLPWHHFRKSLSSLCFCSVPAAAAALEAIKSSTSEVNCLLCFLCLQTNQVSSLEWARAKRPRRALRCPSMEFFSECK